LASNGALEPPLAEAVALDAPLLPLEPASAFPTKDDLVLALAGADTLELFVGARGGADAVALLSG
jgi:hypothetical protein